MYWTLATVCTEKNIIVLLRKTITRVIFPHGKRVWLNEQIFGEIFYIVLVTDDEGSVY